MSYTPDFTLPPLQHFLRLINQTNDKSYTEAEVYFDPPEPTDIEVGPNTRVIMRAIPGMGYKSSVELTYNRLDINEVFTGNLDLAMEESNDLSAVLAQILQQYSFNLTDEDVQLTPAIGGLAILSALQGSYIVTGQVPVQFIVPEPPVVGDLQITGFDNVAITGFDGEPLEFFAEEPIV
jgi:hypothetical protein